MPTVTVVVVGAGPAGLAVSHELSTRGVDHVVLDRGRTAESWRSRRWDSLRLLSPAWATRLPGLPPAPDPDAFLTAGELVDVLDRYAVDAGVPVVEHADVLSVRRCDDRYRIVSTAGTWTASAVVLATGDAAVPAVPAAGRHLSPDVHQLAPDTYRRPSQLPDGGVLVVGASASGVQLADELAASGREVVLAVGRHTRMVRTYRGVDVYWWMQRLGSLDRSIDTMADHAAALSEPSLQLGGHGPSARRARDLSLPALAERGVRLTGRVTGASRGRVFLADDLLHTTTAADARFDRFLERVDRHVRDTGLQREVLDAGPAPARLASTESPTELSLAGAGIRTVLWATGFRRSHPWLHVPVLDLDGDVVHRHGVTASPGLYVVGWRWLTRRSSSFLAGMGEDATSVVSDLVCWLHRHRPQQVVHPSRQEHTS